MMDTTPIQVQPGKKDRRAATWLALASAVTAVAAAVISGVQVHVASEQNIAAEQQELLALTTDIAQQFAQQQANIRQAAGNLTGQERTMAISAANIAMTTHLVAEGQAGAVLITKLHGNGVVGMEYIQVGRALAMGDETTETIAFYKAAMDAPPRAAGTRATALRYLASLYYDLGQPVTGHDYNMKAVRVYGGHRELSRFKTHNGMAQSYLVDAKAQLRLGGCKIAAADMAAARRTLSVSGVSGQTSTNKGLYRANVVAYGKRCAAGPGLTSGP